MKSFHDVRLVSLLIVFMENIRTRSVGRLVAFAISDPISTFIIGNYVTIDLDYLFLRSSWDIALFFCLDFGASFRGTVVILGNIVRVRLQQFSRRRQSEREKLDFLTA